MTTTAILKGLLYVAVKAVAIVSTPENCRGLLSITFKIGTYYYIYEKNVTCNMIDTASNEGKGTTDIVNHMNRCLKIN